MDWKLNKTSISLHKAVLTLGQTQWRSDGSPAASDQVAPPDHFKTELLASGDVYLWPQSLLISSGC